MFAKVLLLAVIGMARGQETKFDPAAELGYFSSCRGQQITYPPDIVSAGGGHLATCTTESLLNPEVANNKNCMGLCVAEKFGYIKEDRSYDFEKAVKPLDDASKAGTMKKWIVDLQEKALRECTTGKKFERTPPCETSKAFDDCIRKAQATDCAADLPPSAAA